MKKENIIKAQRLANVFRFIDDLCTINDNGLFENNFKSIYPAEMELKKENDGHNIASFLDLDISIINNQFELKLFDKRDAFPFEIVRMPYLSNNMPSNIFYSTLGSELLRIANCTTGKTDFISTSKNLLARMKKQGAKPCRLEKCLKRLFGSHMNCFLSFFENSKQLTSALLP